MKFIHLADLHIGKRVNGYSMIEDQKYIFKQIIQHVEHHQVDAVLISGDVYDKPVPTTEAVQLFDQFLTELIQMEVSVLVIAGNHDSPERLDFASRIISRQGLHVSAVYRGRLHEVILRDQWGDVGFYLMPFLKPSFVRGYFPDQNIETYNQAVAAALGQINLNESRRNVLLSHQFYIGSGNTPERSDSEIISVGGVDSIDISHVASFDYVALGHLHGGQQVGHSHIRYSGSPLKYSFSESHHKKSALLAELQEKGNLSLTALPLVPRREMRRIKGPLAELLSASVSSKADPQDYLHITLTDEEEIHDAVGKVRAVYPNMMTLTFENKRTAAVFSIADESVQSVADPLQVFDEFYSLQNGQGLSAEQQSLVQELLDQKGGSL